jgi:hypothetical protein
MDEAASFYRELTRFDLASALNRNAIVLYWSFEDQCFLAQSRYVVRFVGRGETEEQALNDYCNRMNEPENWRKVADEFLGVCAEYQDSVRNELRLSRESDDAFEFWNIIWEAFVEAYNPPVNKDCISRIYAYAEWCSAQLLCEESQLARF